MADPKPPRIVRARRPKPGKPPAAKVPAISTIVTARTPKEIATARLIKIAKDSGYRP